MTTVLELVQNAAGGIGLEEPSTLSSSDEPDNVHWKRLLYTEARHLRRLRCWPQQKKAHSFSTEASRQKYPLPADFYAIVGETSWDQTSALKMQETVTDREWNARLYRYTLLGPPYGFRVFGPDFNPNTSGGQFQVNPTPSSVVTLSYEYFTKNMFLPKHWLPSTAYTSGVYVNANGNIYLCDTNGTSHASTPPSGVTQNITDGTTRWDYVSTAYETILFDTDLCLFDDDIVILGLQWRWLKSKVQDYSREYQDWRDAIAPALTRWKGSVRGSMSRVKEPSPRYHTPDRGWAF